MTELVETASSCDIGLNPFVNVCKNTEFALPNKFFEYMMAGLAVMSSDLIEMRQLTQSLDVGRVFPQLTPRAMADTLNELLSNRDAIARYRQNSYFAARERYNWETVETSFLENFHRFTAGGAQ
jgi:glycosyltransferase involved in cell wall biosynthesis